MIFVSESSAQNPQSEVPAAADDIDVSSMIDDYYQASEPCLHIRRLDSQTSVPSLPVLPFLPLGPLWVFTWLAKIMHVHHMLLVLKPP